MYFLILFAIINLIFSKGFTLRAIVNLSLLPIILGKHRRDGLFMNKNKAKTNHIFHIVVEPNTGMYALLDSKLQTVDIVYRNFESPTLNFIFRRFELHKFKKLLKSDLKSYKKDCKKNYDYVSYDFFNMYKKMFYYLKLCPDADYQILKLLRRNVTFLNSNYSNYQTACAEYLRELAKFENGDACNLPFDINFATDNIGYNNHKYISNVFGKSDDPIKSFSDMCRDTNSKYDFIKQNKITPHRKHNIFDRARLIKMYDDDSER